MRKILFGLALFGTSVVPVLAAGPASAPKPATTTPEKPKEEIKVGELRVDGKLKALLGEGTWQIEAQSWTSPRNVTTDFDELKNKGVQIAPDAYIHPRGEPEKVPMHDVKLGTRMGVIGKNGADGIMQVREIILLEGYGSHKEVGVLASNPYTSVLVKQSRDARDAGLLPKALTLIENGIATAKGMGDMSGEGLASQDRAILLMDMERYEEAYTAFQRVVSLGKNLDNPLLTAMGLGGVGAIQRGSGKLDEAIATFKEADQISTNSEPEIRRSILSSLASSYFAADKPTEGVEALRRLQPLEDAAGRDADGGTSLLTIALVHAVDDPSSARAILTQVQPRIDNANEPKGKSELLGYKALVEWRLGDTEPARQDFESAAVLNDGLNAPALAKYWRAMPDRLANVGTDWSPFWNVVRGREAKPADGAKPDDGAKPATTGADQNVDPDKPQG